MTTTSSTSSRLHPDIQQGLINGTVKQIKIDGKYYVIYKVQDGALTSPFNESEVDMGKIRKVAKLWVDTHKSNAQQYEDLKNKEIVQLDIEGARFKDDNTGLGVNCKARVTSAEDYLKQTDDFDWQAPTLTLSQYINTEIQNFERNRREQGEDGPPASPLRRLPAEMFPSEFRAYLKSKGVVESNEESGHTYTINLISDDETKGLREHLLDYTREKIERTLAIHAQVPCSKITPEEINGLFTCFNTVEGMISVSNNFIAQKFTAAHIYHTLLKLTNNTRPEVYVPETSPPSSPRKRSFSFDNSDSDDEDGAPPTSPRSPKKIPGNITEDFSIDSPRKNHKSPDGLHMVRLFDDTSDDDSGYSSDSDFFQKTHKKTKVHPFPSPGGKNGTGTFSQRPEVSTRRTNQRFMSPEESRLTRAYRSLLDQINQPIDAEGPKDFTGAYEKLKKFRDNPETEELEFLSPGELLAVRDAHEKVMKVEDYKRHAHLKDDRYFDAILFRLEHSR